MALDTNIPMSGITIDTVNPLQKLATGIAQKKQYDQEQAYAREQDTLNRQRQDKMDAAALSSKSLNDQLTREQLISQQFKNMDEREQSRIKSVAIAAAQVKPFLDAGDTEGALNFAVARQNALHARMGKGENIDDTDTAAFIDMLQKGDIESAKHHVDAMVQVGQYTGALKIPKAASAGTTTTIDPVSGEVTYTAPPKAMPASALKMQNEALDIIGTANNTQADLGALIGQLDSGGLELGPLTNFASGIVNYSGFSNEKTRNFATFQTTLEKLRNDSLRLNKGVQTEGDAQRAWNEILANQNDAKLVSERLKEIQAINQRAAELKQLEVDNIRANYNQPPVNYDPYQKGPAIGAPEQGGVLQTPSGVKYRVVQ